MVEFLGIAASLIAIASAVVAVRRWLRPTQVVTSDSLRKAEATFDFYFKQWSAASYALKHVYIVPWEDFVEIGRHRRRFLSLTGDENCYLMVCTVKHRMWDWWSPNADPMKLICALSTLLDGKSGWSPIWRAAFRIENLAERVSAEWYNDLPIELSSNENFIEAISVVRTTGVVKYLERVSQTDTSYIRDKAFAMLEDIRDCTGEKVELKYPDFESQ